MQIQSWIKGEICLHRSREDKAKHGVLGILYFRIKITEKVLSDSQQCRHRRHRNIAQATDMATWPHGHMATHMATDSGVVLNQLTGSNRLDLQLAGFSLW